MRTIKFRGKAIEPSLGWVYGDLVQISNSYPDIHRYKDTIEVNGEKCKRYELDKVSPETVGQFTGLIDKNGKEIYEGDIVILATNDKHTPWPSNVITVSKCKVVFYPQLSSLVMETIIEDEDPDLYGEYTHFGAIEIDSVEVIGNIYDDTEMLKGGAQ